MASLQDTIRLGLEADGSLTTILTGGIFDASELDREGLSLGDVQDPTTKKVKPCAVLRWRGSSPTGPTDRLNAEARFLEVYLYEDMGTVNVEAAKRRLKQLLHRQSFLAANFGLVWLRWAGDFGEFSADELGGASADMARFEVTLTRK
jgi:hypothetical protein